MSIPETENNFDFYLKFAKPLVLNLTEPNNRALAAAWIQKLRNHKVGTEELRTDYLKLLLFVLQRKKLIGIFTDNPNQYQKLDEVPETNLKEVAKELLEAEDNFRLQQEVPSKDFPPYSTEHSADLLEYAAAQDIPNFGVHAYYAISKEPLPNWERTEKAVFPRNAVSETDRDRSRSPSTVSSKASLPELDDDLKRRRHQTQSREKFKSKSRSRSKSRKDVSLEEEDKLSEVTEVRITPTKRQCLKEYPPSPLLGYTPKEDKRSPPTWGTNLISVSEPPVREIIESLQAQDEELTFLQSDSIQSTGSSKYHSLPFKTPSPRQTYSTYSPILPGGERDPLFFESPPSFLEADSMNSLGQSSASQHRTPSSRRSRASLPPTEVSSYFEVPASFLGIESRNSTGSPRYSASSNMEPRTPRISYSPPFPSGEQDPFFLESPPSFLNASSIASLSPSQASFRQSPTNGGRGFHFNEDNLGNFHMSNHQSVSSRTSFNENLNEFNNMIGEYEGDDNGGEPPLPYRSPARAPVLRSPLGDSSGVSSTTVRRQPIKKIIKKTITVTKTPSETSNVCPAATVQSSTGSNNPPPRCTSTAAGPSQIASRSQTQAVTRSRIPAYGGSSRLILCPGRNPRSALAPGTSRIPRSQTNYRPVLPGRSGIPIRLPQQSARTSQFTQRERGLWSPELPQGEADALYMESPPSFMNASSLPSASSTRYPSSPYATPSRQFQNPPVPDYDFEQLKNAIQGLDDANMSQVTITSEIAYEEPPEEWDRNISEIENRERTPRHSPKRSGGRDSPERAAVEQIHPNRSPGWDFEEQERTYANSGGTRTLRKETYTIVHDPQIAHDAADRQYERLAKYGALEDEYEEYKKRYKHRPLNMPPTPPPFSKFLPLMGEEQDRMYDLSEFDVNDDEQWDAGRRFFDGKTSLSPRGDPRGSEAKRRFGVPAGQLLDDESEADLVDYEFETSTVGERSPAATRANMRRKLHEAETELSMLKRTTPAGAGIPVTTPRRSTSPRRPGKSIRVETEGGQEVSFHFPPYETPTRASRYQAGIMEESPVALVSPSPSPRTPRRRAANPKELSLFYLAPPLDLDAEEPPEEMMFESPYQSPPRSPVESPIALRRRLYEYDEPVHYSQQEMPIATGRTRSNRRMIQRKSAKPSLTRLRELPDSYQEENVPFLSQVEAARGFSSPSRRMRVGGYNMDNVLESPIVVQNEYLPDVPLPDDLLGAKGPVNWQTSPGELDRSLPKGLPSPIRPPTVVPGWVSPPGQRIHRQPRGLQLPGPYERVRIPPRARDFVAQEMPPTEMFYSPPQLSPGEYQRLSQRTDVRPQRSRSPGSPGGYQQPPNVVRPVQPSIFDVLPMDDIGLDAEELPDDFYETPPRVPILSPISPGESPTSLRRRLNNAAEPDYYSKAPIAVATGRTASKYRMIPRRSAAPGLNRLRELPDDYNEEHVPFLSQVEGSKSFSRTSKRMKVAVPAMDPLTESPIVVPNRTQDGNAVGLKRIIDELTQIYADLPDLPEEPLPDDMMGVKGRVPWKMSPGILDRSISERLPSPIKPPTVVPGWISPPGRKIARQPRALQLPEPGLRVRIPPRARDFITQEIPPSEMAYSPLQLSPEDYVQSRVPSIFDVISADEIEIGAVQPDLYQSPVGSPRISKTAARAFFSSPPADYAGLDEEGPPNDLYETPPSPIRAQRPPLSPISQRGISRRSPESSHLGLRKLPPQNNRMGFGSPDRLSQPSDSPRGSNRHTIIRKVSRSRIPQSDPNTSVEVIETEERVQPGGDVLKEVLQSLDQRFADLPDLPQPEHPDDLFGMPGPVNWEMPEHEINKPVPGGLRSPIRPPTVVPGWSTPPHLRKRQTPRQPNEFKLIPALRDILFQEMPPSDLFYSPTSSSPGPEVPQSSSSRSKINTSPYQSRKILDETPPAELDYVSPCQPCGTPRTPPRQQRDIFKQEPQFLLTELPPAEFMPADSPPSAGYYEKRLRFAKQPMSPDETVDSFEAHELSAGRSPMDRMNIPAGNFNVVSPRQQLQSMQSKVNQQLAALDRQSPDETVDSFEAHELSAGRSPMNRMNIPAGNFNMVSPRQQLQSMQSKVNQQLAALDRQSPAQFADLDRSLLEFEEMEKAILQSGERRNRGPPPRAAYEQMLDVGARVSRQHQELHRSPSWLERVEQGIADVPQPYLPLQRPQRSPYYGQIISPEWSPRLPRKLKYASPIEAQAAPDGVWNYESPRTPIRTPQRTPQQAVKKSPPNIFDVKPMEREYLDDIGAPDMPESPGSPPNINDYYSPRYATPPRPPPPTFAESVKAHKYTDRFYDRGRYDMTNSIRVKNRVTPLTGSVCPAVSPIGEEREGNTSVIQETVEETVVQKGAPEKQPSQFNRSLDFDSPPLPPRIPYRPPTNVGYVPGPRYQDELMFQSPPEFYESPQRDVFDESGRPEIFESTPPAGYYFSPPPLSPVPSPYSPYMGFTPPPGTPSQEYEYSSPSSSIDPDSFRQSVREHQYTDQFFTGSRPAASNFVRSGNRIVHLPRSSVAPSLNAIGETYDELSVSSTNIPSCFCPSDNPTQNQPVNQSPGRTIEESVTVIETGMPWDYSNRRPFEGQNSPVIMDTSLIPSDLDASYIDEDISDFKWMG